MPPRLELFTRRSLAFRTRPSTRRPPAAPIGQRWASDSSKDLPVAEKGTSTGPNQQQAPHVSEEQAAMDKITGDTPPDIEGQGTPISEVMNRDQDAKENAPEVMKNASATSQPKPKTSPAGSSGTRSFSTSTKRRAEMGVTLDPEPQGPAVLEYPEGGLGHKFALPEMPMPRTEHLKRRYDPVVEQLTKSLMRHGKLSAAQKPQNMSIILDTLRTSPPPQPAAARPLLLPPGLPASLLPLSPIAYLTTAIDSLAPLIKIRQQRGVMGGGASLPIPVPMGVKQRRRTAMQWILAAAGKRKESRLADRVSREIINVANGTSSAWERRGQVNKMAISARSNVRWTVRGGRR